MKYKHRGQVENGKLKIFNKDYLLKDIKTLDGKRVVLTIERAKKTRSLSQNSYYWAVVVPMVREGLVDRGYRISLEAAHEYLKSEFLKVELVNEETGEILPSTGSTKEATTTDFMAYIEDIQRWAAEYLVIYIPSPNEQIEMNYEESVELKV